MNASVAVPRTGSSSLVGSSPVRAGKRVAMLKSRRGPVLAVAGKTYTVKPGDSVYAIAVKYKVTTDEILAANQADFSGGTTTIYPAQTLNLPDHAQTGVGGTLGWVIKAVAVAVIAAAVIYVNKNPPKK